MGRILTEGIAWNRGINIVSDTEKKCSTCKEIKILDCFHKTSRSYGGFNNECKPCRSKRDKLRPKETRHREYLKNRQKQLDRDLFKHYGITRDQFNEMRVKQDYLCAICSKHESESNKGLHTDHCHDTKKVRGLLCNACNLAIGQLKHNTTILLKAISYLKQ